MEVGYINKIKKGIIMKNLLKNMIINAVCNWSTLLLLVISISMFMLGRVSNNTRTPELVDESQELNYVIESGYVPTEINFEEEANYIKNNIHSSISKSKIKH